MGSTGGVLGPQGEGEATAEATRAATTTKTVEKRMVTGAFFPTVWKSAADVNSLISWVTSK